MKTREINVLKDKAINSLIFAIEVFNRPYDANRQDISLISLDHAFEMHLKASLLNKGGQIKESEGDHTFGFAKCVNLALNGSKKFLDENQARTLRIINGLRDSAHHYILDLSEQQLYMHIQSGVTIFSDLLLSVFGEKLGDRIPERVLPISIHPPKDISILIEDDLSRIEPLLSKGKRRKFEARSMIRGIAVMDATIQGKDNLPTDSDLNKMLDKIKNNDSWGSIFPGIAALELNTTGDGTPVHLRFTKSKDAIPIRTVQISDDESLPLMGIKRVNELDFYKFGLRKIAKKVNVTEPKASALVEELKIKENDEFFKIITIDSSKHPRYSIKAVKYIKERLPTLDLEKVWENYKKRHYGN